MLPLTAGDDATAVQWIDVSESEPRYVHLYAAVTPTHPLITHPQVWTHVPNITCHADSTHPRPRGDGRSAYSGAKKVAREGR